MKLLAILMLCAIVAAAPKGNTENHQVLPIDLQADFSSVESRNILINALIRQLFTYIRFIINNGSSLLGLPPLDPLSIERYHLEIPAGLINLDLQLEDIFATGFGGFVVHASNFNARALTFHLDISVPRIDIRSKYDLLGDLFTAIPLFGKGDAEFVIEGFRFQATLFLKQSEDGTSVLIDRIESPAFQLPQFQANLTGVIGGGDIDAIANAIVEEVLIDYVNRFQGAIALVASEAVMLIGNPILDQLDTWRYIAPFV